MQIEVHPSEIHENPGVDGSPVAFVETDRYCDACGFNLRTQAISRDAQTGILVMRCPECGRYHSADAATAVGRRWLQRLATLLLLIWIILTVALSAAMAMGTGGVMVGTLEELTRHKTVKVPINGGVGFTTTWGRVIDDEPEHYMEFMTLMSVLSFTLPFVWLSLLGVICHHWRRWVLMIVAIVVPAGVGLVVWTVWCTEAPNLTQWGFNYVGYHVLLQSLGGLTASIAGRPAVRAVVRAILPPRWRSPLAFMWLADGKRPPISDRLSTTA